MKPRRRKIWIYRLTVTAALVALDAAIWTYNEWLPLGFLAPVVKAFRWNFFHHAWFILIPLLMVGLYHVPRERYGLTWKGRDLAFGLGVTAILALVPLTVGAWTGHLDRAPRVQGHLLETLVFQLVFAAFGEEVFYRGFMQGTLNRTFGRPWRTGGTRFGAGLFIVALLFGIGHLLNDFDPLKGKYTLSWGWGLNSFGAGLIFGIARERTGSLLVPVLIHAGSNVYPVFIAHTPAGGYAMSAAWGAAIFFVIWWVVDNRQGSVHADSSALCQGQNDGDRPEIRADS